MGMEIKNPNLSCEVTKITDDRVSVEILFKGNIHLGILYYEKAKKSWFRKPITPNKWRCVDAKVERLFIQGEGEYTPLDIMVMAQAKVEEFMEQGS